MLHAEIYNVLTYIRTENGRMDASCENNPASHSGGGADEILLGTYSQQSSPSFN